MGLAVWLEPFRAVGACAVDEDKSLDTVLLGDPVAFHEAAAAVAAVAALTARRQERDMTAVPFTLGLPASITFGRHRRMGQSSAMSDRAFKLTLTTGFHLNTARRSDHASSASSRDPYKMLLKG